MTQHSLNDLGVREPHRGAIIDAVNERWARVEFNDLASQMFDAIEYEHDEYARGMNIRAEKSAHWVALISLAVLAVPVLAGAWLAWG
jgi:hypothetical protein